MVVSVAGCGGRNIPIINVLLASLLRFHHCAPFKYLYFPEGRIFEVVPHSCMYAWSYILHVNMRKPRESGYFDPDSVCQVRKYWTRLKASTETSNHIDTAQLEKPLAISSSPERSVSNFRLWPLVLYDSVTLKRSLASMLIRPLTYWKILISLPFSL